MKAVEVKDSFIKNVVTLLKEYLAEGNIIEYAIPEADGWAEYLFKDTLLYVGGMYGRFAGEYSHELMSGEHESSFTGVRIGTRIFNNPDYDMTYTLEQAETYMDLHTATRILHMIIKNTA